MRTQLGQATFELILSAGLIAVTLSGVGWILKLEWDRARCAYLVFEQTHARTMKRSSRPSPLRVSIEEGTRQVRGKATCGAVETSVSFSKLEGGR